MKTVLKVKEVKRHQNVITSVMRYIHTWMPLEQRLFHTAEMFCSVLLRGDCGHRGCCDSPQLRPSYEARPIVPNPSVMLF